MVAALIVVILFLLSTIATGFYRSWALRHNLLDCPNQRSSHAIPTPRGAGIILVMLTILTWLGLLIGALFENTWINFGNIVFLAVLVIVSMLGFLDDKYHLSARFRLFIQFITFSGFIAWLFMIPWFVYPVVSAINHHLILYTVLICISCLFLLWMTNLFNFMDGINGIASLQAIFFFMAVSALFQDAFFYPLQQILWYLPAIILGFTVWNFPYGKVFLGDAGSMFLGAMIALVSLYLATTSVDHFIICLILMAVFISDASLTLLLRFIKGQPITEAHCSHAYQNASKYFSSHSVVALGILAIDLFWLLPCALLVWLDIMNPVIAIFIAYTPIIALAFLFRAGQDIRLLRVA